MHESPPFATPDAKSCFCFPSLWQSKRKKPNFFAKNGSGKTLAEVTEMLYSLGEISGTHIFINGTKIESAANRYTFVWKKAVTKHQQILCQKIAVFVEECEILYGTQLRMNRSIQVGLLSKTEGLDKCAFSAVQVL